MINENLGNVRQTWKIVNEIVNKTSRTTKIGTIKIDNKIITNNKKIPNIMNRFFCSLGEKLKADIPQKPNSLITGKYNISPNNKTFQFLEHN